MECGDKRLVTDPVTAFVAVGSQDLCVLWVNAGMKRFKRLVTRASWPEALAMGLALRLPCRFHGECRPGLSGAIPPDGHP